MKLSVKYIRCNNLLLRNSKVVLTAIVTGEPRRRCLSFFYHTNSEFLILQVL